MNNENIKTLIEFLRDGISELNGYAEDEDNGYDDCERHDCVVAAEAYEEILNFVMNLEKGKKEDESY